MSSNIGAEAKKKYSEYLDAKNIDERIKLLEEFISLVPKHKATEKIVALNRSKLAKLRKEKENKEQFRKRITSGGDDPFSIQRERDFVQVILISDYFGDDLGAGKSELLKNLTGLSALKPGIHTIVPKIGIYDWNRIKFQMIEMPALHEWQKLPRILAVLRTTDIIGLVIDLSRDPIKQFENIITLLENANIYLNYEKPEFDIQKTGSGGIKLLFRGKKGEKSAYLEEFIRDMIKENGMRNAIVKIYDELTIQQVEMAFNLSSAFKRAFIIATKGDDIHSKNNFIKLKEFIEEIKDRQFLIYPVAITLDDSRKKLRKGLDNLGLDLLNQLQLIRIYTKSKKGVADLPLVIHKNATIADVAKKIHKDLFKHFRYASVYRIIDNERDERRKYRVGLDFVIEEFDIVEINSDI